eukprot:Seg2297.6 transcript_id=Seg2297.6/GoldUCD/mRNA.D3Y31 product="Stabilizer of axonemal microtubules 1" protein_id=Seg2297.6/GoldUCD/D3Y31
MVKSVLCICEICTCGRHHCVHRPRSAPHGEKRCLLTEYHDTYKEFPASSRAQPIKPPSRTHISKQPFEKSTMYKDIYVPYKYKPPVRHSQPDYVKPSGDMHSSTTYTTDYLERKVRKPKLAKADYNAAISDAPFVGDTVHNETYKPWDIPKMESVHPPKEAIRKSSAKFNHSTTVQHDFPGYFRFGRDTAFAPEPTLKTGVGPMSDQTTHRIDFDRKHGHPEKSAKPIQREIRTAGPFEDETTNNHAYTWPNATAAESCKPALPAFTSDKPFEGDTTHKATYKQWNVPRRDAWKPQVAWKPPNDSFEKTTTFRHAFQGKPTPKVKSAKPDIIRPPPGEFRDHTTHKETYKPWEYSQRAQYKPNAGYRPPTAPFYGKTTNRSHYRGDQARRPDICKPKQNGIVVGGEHEFSTNYADDYANKKVPPCPAKDLKVADQTKDGFKFARDTNGHQYYYPPNAMGMGERIETLALA